MGGTRGIYRVLVGNLKEREHLGDPGIDIKMDLSGSGMCTYGLDQAGSG